MNSHITNGQNGGQYFADTTVHAPDATSSVGRNGWGALQMITDTVLDTGTVGNIQGLNGVTLPAGTIIFGRWTAIQLASGGLIAYLV